MAETLDVVYAWVDGAWPGYQEEVARHASRPVDSNPNRYRDNLDLLKYSLRSLEAFAPWIGRIHIVTARPQVPGWLDLKAPGIRIVHHDVIFEPRHLPAFNSFAIESCLSRIPGVSTRFLYINDDMLLGRPLRIEEVMTADFKARIHLEWNRSAAKRSDDHPWRAAVGFGNELLDSAFGIAPARRLVRHVPVMMDVRHWDELGRRWPEAIESTRAAKFRSKDSFAPDFLYPYFCLEMGYAEAVPVFESYRTAAYIGLENQLWLMAPQLAFVNRLRPVFLTLNDNFGDNPSERVVARVRQFLDGWFPKPSRFEIQ